MRTWWMASVLVVLSLTGCGDSPEHKVLLATQMLRQGSPNEALTLVESVINAEAGNAEPSPILEQAVFIKAQALLSLNQFDASRKVLEQIKKDRPTDPEPVRALASWAFKSMQTAVGKSEFDTNLELLKQFEDALEVAFRQADELALKHKLAAESEFLRARILMQDIARFERTRKGEMSRAERQRIATNAESNSPESAQILERLNRNITRRKEETEKALANVLKEEPKHTEASLMYIGMLSDPERGGWKEILAMADDLAAQKDLAARVVSPVISGVLRVPDSVKPQKSRVELCRKLLAVTLADEHTSPPYLLSSAYVHLTLNEADKALALLEQVQNADPESQMQARFLEAWCLFLGEKYERSRYILDDLDTKTRSPHVLVLHARVLWKLGDRIRAEEQVNRAMDLDSSFPPAILLSQEIKSSKGDQDQVEKDLKERLTGNPQDPVNNQLYVSKLMAANDTAVLERHLASMEKFLPLKDEHVAVLVEGFTFLKRHDKTLQYANLFKQRRPDQLVAHLKYAEALMANGQQKQASEYLEGIKARFPDAGNMEMTMAQLMLQRQQFDDAAAAAKKFVEKNPGDIEARLLLARALAAQSKIDEARRQLDEILAVDPRNKEANGIRARIEFFLGNVDEAGKHLAQIDEGEVDENANPTLKALILMQKDKLVEARDLCNAAVGKGNPDPVLQLLLARIYLLQKDPTRAEVPLLALARVQTTNTQVYRLLGEFYASTKELHNAGIIKLKDLQQYNDTQARLALSTVYLAQGKPDEATLVLDEVFKTLLDKKDTQVLDVADGLARIHLKRKDVDKVVEIYKSVQDKGVSPKEAWLRQIDLTWGNPSVHYSATQLGNLAKDLKAEDESLRSQVLERLLKLDKTDQSIAVIDEWLKQTPGEPTLLRWKAQVLAQTGKFTDAIATFREAIAKAPTNMGLRARLVATHLANFDFPAAEKELQEMRKLDERTKVLALAELGQLYARLGLNRQATRAFEELEKISKVSDPTILFTMGNAMARLEMFEQARERLAKVPGYARLYPAAQVQLARLEMRGGLESQARDRVNALINDLRMTLRGMTELLALNPYDKENGRRDMQILRWADDTLKAKPDAWNLTPRQTKSQWLRVRVMLQDNVAKDRADYEELIKTLDEWQNIEPNALSILKARLAVLARLDQQAKARQLFRSFSQLANMPDGPVLAVVVGIEPAKVDRRSPLAEYLVALATAKPAAAKLAAEALETHPTIYRKDLLSALDRTDVNSAVMGAAARQMATARIALEAGLPALCASLSENLIKNLPDLVPAHGLLAQALMSQGLPLTDALARAQQHIPAAGITHYMAAETKVEANDNKTAAEHLNKILEAEPDNIHARYRLSQVLQLAGQHELSITTLEKLHAQGGNYRLMVSNDLAYLLAVHAPDRLEEAHGIAKRAYELVEQNAGNTLGAAALQDTVGWIEHMKKNDAVALHHLSRSIPQLNERPEVHYHIAVVYDMLGNKTWARYHLEQAATGDKRLPEVKEAANLLTKLGAGG